MMVSGAITINWALAGFIKMDIINKIINAINVSYLSTIVYAIAGICGAVILVKYRK